MAPTAFNIAVEATEPRTMRELEEQMKAFRAAADLVGAQNYDSGDVDTKTEPFLERAEQLETLAADMPIETLGDVLAAISVYEGMFFGDLSEYADKRDARLWRAIREGIERIADRQRPVAAAPPARRPELVEPGLALDCADAINQIRHSLALSLEVVESRVRDHAAELERASASGLVELLYQQIERLEKLRDRLHKD